MINLALDKMGLVSVLILGLALLSQHYRLGLGKQVLIGGFRAWVQLFLVGSILGLVFADVHWMWLALFLLVMVAAAVREIRARQGRRIKGWKGVALPGVALTVSGFAMGAYGILLVVQPEPWYHPQYVIPLMGMILGNSMTAISISLDRFTQALWDKRNEIEQRLMQGETAQEAIGQSMILAARAGMIPIINAMTTAGLVNLPGMMTGQILAGSPPLEAVKYQIMILFLIACTVGMGVVMVLRLSSRSLFDERDRLRLDLLLGKNS